jgi:hypothetical protein
MSQGDSFSIMSDYGLEDQNLIPDKGIDFSSSPCVQTSNRAYPASCAMGIGSPFPGGNAQPGHDADHSLLSSTKVKKV